jgi:hypothetical protein
MAARRTILSALTVLAVGLSLLAGCTPADPVGQPTYACTPDDGSTPYSCYKVQYDAKAKEAALYAEAEVAFRRFLTEDERINRSGGVTEPTPVLLETTTGDYLASAMANYSTLKNAGATATGGEYKTAWIKRVPGDAKGGSVATLTACLDTSSVMMSSRGKAPVPGRITQRTGYFVREAGALKLAFGRYKWVTTC